MHHDEDDPFDIEKFRVPEGVLVPDSFIAVKKKQRRRQQFIMVPYSWMEALREARHTSTFRVALYLLYRHWKDRGEPVSFSNTLLDEWGVTRREKWRALTELEYFKLVKVVRRPRRAPLVTVLVDQS
jgi:hypothetical protein